ncbi:DUF1540 domain-containing protein [Oscillospiraceae bacterium OttesenSCG-928-G22]|nr:DUF1540 domain-containing protein [Oscillospiraceae bacterium OttesenSCG-928-G22]
MFGSDRGRINGISCTARNCIHHSENNCCTAGEIRVGTEYASEKAETICGTFEKR